MERKGEEGSEDLRFSKGGKEKEGEGRGKERNLVCITRERR